MGPTAHRQRSSTGAAPPAAGRQPVRQRRSPRAVPAPARSRIGQARGEHRRPALRGNGPRGGAPPRTPHLTRCSTWVRASVIPTRARSPLLPGNPDVRCIRGRRLCLSATAVTDRPRTSGKLDPVHRPDAPTRAGSSARTSVTRAPARVGGICACGRGRRRRGCGGVLASHHMLIGPGWSHAGEVATVDPLIAGGCATRERAAL